MLHINDAAVHATSLICDDASKTSMATEKENAAIVFDSC